MSKGIRSTKRSGRDIKAVVGSYLRRRHYIDSSESFKSSELVTKQSRRQMSYDAAIEKDSSSINSILYWSNNADSRKVEDQLLQLWRWLKDLDDVKCKSELSMMLLPLYFHLFLDTYQYGKRISVSPTIIETFSAYYSNDEANEITNALSRISSVQDIDRISILKAFRSCKYQVRLSNKASNSLMKFLQSQSLMALLGVLQKWFELDVYPDGCSVQEDDDAAFLESLFELDQSNSVLKGTSMNPGLSRNLNNKHVADRWNIKELEFSSSSSAWPSVNSSSSSPHTIKYAIKESDMRQLQEAIRIVREAPSLTAPVLVYSLNHTESVISASVSRTYKLLATGSMTSEVRLWNLQETKLPPNRIQHIPLGCDSDSLLYPHQESRYCTLRGHSGPVYDTKFIHKAEVVLSVGHDNEMRAWNLNDYTCAAVYKGHNFAIWSVGVDRFGLHIATGSQDRTVRLWNLDRIHPLRIFAGHTQDVNCVRFHPNGAYIASASHDKTIRLWDCSAGTMVRVFVGHSGGVTALAFSPNGSFLASAGDGGRVKIWDIASSKLIADLKGHTNKVVSIDWSNDGSTVASVSSDGTMLSWKVDKLHKMPRSSSGHPHGVTSGHGHDDSAREINTNELAVLEDPHRYPTGFSRALSVEFTPRNTCIAVGIKEVPVLP